MNCPACGSKMIWNSDFDYEEVYGEGEGKGVVSYHSCSNDDCQSEFTHIQKVKEEKACGEGVECSE